MGQLSSNFGLKADYHNKFSNFLLQKKNGDMLARKDVDHLASAVDRRHCSK